MTESRPILTYQTRVEVNPETDRTLNLCTQLLSKVTHCLFAQIMAGCATGALKNSFLKRFGITARQFNACRVLVEGKIASLRELNHQRIKDLKAAIEKSETRVQSYTRKSMFTKCWCQKQRLARLKKKLAEAEQERISGKVRCCFGSKKLFRRQFTEELSHEEWKTQWRQRRNSEFFTLGSKDENGGNQTCTATIAADGSLSLRLRLPDGLSSGKHLELQGIRFTYGHDAILTALEECRLRTELYKRNDPAYKDHGQAISFRFLRDKKGWLVFASTAIQEPQWVTDKRLGAIGLDINSDHLAIVEMDRHGNAISHETIPCSLNGTTQHQAKAVIGDSCARAIEIAASTKKPLIVEQLDFANKKRTLREMRPSDARKLSSFAYSAILQMLRSRAYRQGVELFSVNPAFTSFLGRIKFAARYGLTIHHAAALCIARRYYGFSESLPKQSSVPDGKGRHIAFFVPERNQEKHEWSYFRRVAKKLRAALAEHFRVARGQSSDPPGDPCDEKSSNFVGVIPTRESLATLLG